MKRHPCLTCGACCAKYRVSFHWSETLTDSHFVPVSATEKLNVHHFVLKGTNQSPARCEQLQGHLGRHVSCGIYENRPSPCREFSASFENGIHDERCDQARRSIGLNSLTQADWDLTV